jgi:UPF0716 protein FxsA
LTKNQFSRHHFFVGASRGWHVGARKEKKPMGRLLFGIFLIVPIIEIGIFILVGQAIGLWPTLGGVVLTAFIGSFIIRLQGISLISEIRQLSARGALPARQIADGVMLAIAGALLLTPGYFTDLMGFLLLVPMVRGLIYAWLRTKIQVGAGFSTQDPRTPDYESGGAPTGGGSQDENVVDLDEDKWRNG